MSQNDSPPIEIDHIGIAVHHLGDSPLWSALGWKPSSMSVEVVDDQKVKVGFLNLKNKARLELLEPTDHDGPVGKFLNKRGPGIHHICLRVNGLDTLLKNLKGQGIRLINETPVSGAHKTRVAFVHPSSAGGVLVELKEVSD